jgi:hypothetical protein
MDITNLEQQSPRTEKRFNQNSINTRCGTINYIKPDKQPELELIINLQNLYINPKTYRTDYNFYNYKYFLNRN